MNFHIVCAKILMLMAKIDETLAQQVKANPKDCLPLIVCVEGDMKAREEQLEALGFIVKRSLRLVHGFAATGDGAAIQKAAGEDWIVSIERDAEVRTMPDEGK